MTDTKSRQPQYIEVWPEFAIDKTSAPAIVPYPDLVEPNIFTEVTSYSPYHDSGMIEKFVQALQPGKVVALGPVSVPSAWVVAGLFGALVLVTGRSKR